MTATLTTDALELLRRLIATPSFSKEENRTADVLEEFFRERSIPYRRLKNNLWARNRYYHPDRPTVLLNSHHDTVRPNPGWTLDPFAPTLRGTRLYGLGSNDAGASLVALLAAFCYFYARPDLQYNVIVAATAEEEISGRDGMELLWQSGMLGPVEFAIVGEPTGMHLAIAEKGLLVLDCVFGGKAGHAARDEGENALYKAVQAIEWLRYYRFPKESPLLGPVKMSVTSIFTENKQHNVVPDHCQMTVDVRVTEQYTLEEVVNFLREKINANITPRSLRLRPSFIRPEHPIVQAGRALGRRTFGSPTTSDQALISCPSLKIGPGDSARSHQADEFIDTREIEEGIRLYIELLRGVILARNPV